MSSLTTYLVTGANRGIGFEYVKELSLRPNSEVIATSRSDSSTLKDLAAERGNITILNLAVDNAESIQKFGQDLAKIPNLKIDYFISNAGIAYSYSKALDTPREEFIDHWTVNALGPLEVLKAVKPFLASKNFLVFVSTIAGSITLAESVPLNVAAYGSSKAALNFLVKQLSKELKDDSIVVSVHPGLVTTDMGSKGVAIIKEMGIDLDEIPDELKPLSVDESVALQLKVIDGLTAEKNGKFFDTDGSEIPW